MAGTPVHHEVFQHFPMWQGEDDPGFLTTFVGAKFRKELFQTEPERRPQPSVPEPPRRTWKPIPLPDNEEYLEWVSLLTAVMAAQDRFVMIELGAGFGRWLVSGACAARRTRRIPFLLVGVEGEPTHFQWMLDVLRDNGIDPHDHLMLEAAVAAEDGQVDFYTGKAQSWYGQRIASAGDVRADTPWFFQRWYRRLLGRPESETGFRKVRAFSLNSILSQLDQVDLIDADIQGTEAEVFEAGAERLAAQVKSVHIGTHSVEQEKRLRRLFTGLGWELQFDFTNGKEGRSPWGVIKFGDGVQAWRNPRLWPAQKGDAQVA
jgi:FkbM family methyltransferase